MGVCGPDERHENITVHAVPLAEVHDWLEAKAKSGLLVDPKLYAGLYFLGPINSSLLGCSRRRKSAQILSRPAAGHARADLHWTGPLGGLHALPAL